MTTWKMIAFVDGNKREHKFTDLPANIGALEDMFAEIINDAGEKARRIEFHLERVS